MNFFAGEIALGTLSDLWNSLDFSAMLSALMRLIAVFLCLTVHETCHGLAAYALGDPTAKRERRLSLNPLHHIDWVGLACMLVLGFGWAKPVPVNMYKFKDPKRGMAITALAGPVSNILITIVFLFIYGLLYIPLQLSAAGQYILQMIMITAYISLGLAVFNFIPVPPLDGSKVLFSLMSDEKYYKLMRYERYGTIIMILLVATGVLGKPLDTAVEWLYNALIPIAQAGCDIIYNLFYS